MRPWWQLFGPTYVPVGTDQDGVIVSVAGFPLGFVGYLTAEEIGVRSSGPVPAAAPQCHGSAPGRKTAVTPCVTRPRFSGQARRPTRTAAR